ncbi:Sec1 family protein [Mesorhizobium sp. B2-7-1]|nr:Sec1 family protein [Mesorhizobium sp. B2-7-1]
MKGRGWIRERRIAEATQVRDQIAKLEQELLAGGGDHRRRTKFHDIGHQLRSHKSRLERLERCISALCNGSKQAPAR